MTAASERQCNTCLLMRPASEFYPSMARCKACGLVARRAHRAANQEQNSVNQRRAMLTYRYGLTPEDYDQMIEAQGGGCAVCGGVNPGIDKRTGQPRRLHVDHDHTTGKVRGILCSPCNLALGHLNESPDRIRALLAYLESHS